MTVKHHTKITPVDTKFEWSCTCGVGGWGYTSVKAARDARDAHLRNLPSTHQKA